MVKKCLLNTLCERLGQGDSCKANFSASFVTFSFTFYRRRKKEKKIFTVNFLPSGAVRKNRKTEWWLFSERQFFRFYHSLSRVSVENRRSRTKIIKEKRPEGPKLKTKEINFVSWLRVDKGLPLAHLMRLLNWFCLDERADSSEIEGNNLSASF